MYVSPKLTSQRNMGLWNIVGHSECTFCCCIKVVVVDNVHCIHNWGKTHSNSVVQFQPEYGNITSLCSFLRKTVLLYVLFTMLTRTVQSRVNKSLNLSDYTVKLKVFKNCSNIILSFLPLWITVHEWTDLNIFIFKAIVSPYFDPRTLKRQWYSSITL